MLWLLSKACHTFKGTAFCAAAGLFPKKDLRMAVALAMDPVISASL